MFLHQCRRLLSFSSSTSSASASEGATSILTKEIADLMEQDSRLSIFKSLRSRPTATILTEQEVASTFSSLKPDLGGDRRDIWHSSSHLLGWALEKRFGKNCLLTDGPATEIGFFYDALIFSDGEGEAFQKERIESVAPYFKGNKTTYFSPQAAAVQYFTHPNKIQNDIQLLLKKKLYFPSQGDLALLQKSMMKLASRHVPFEFIKVSKQQAQLLFIHSPFKLALIDRIPPPIKLPGEMEYEDYITIYRCGDFIDLCRGPHVENSREIGAIKLSNISAAQWSPDTPQVLSRISGVGFTSKEEMRIYEERLIEIEKRNHRVIGKVQGLFTFHPFSPGSPFFLPHGTRILQRLKDYLREEYKKYGFMEVITPLIYSKDLWRKSGHWENYESDMFSFDGSHAHPVKKPASITKSSESDSSEMMGLKPMNCPGHCLLFADTAKSYNDLPLRYAEFSPLHRNEASGALTGLTRVRKFHQDDGHIFCTLDQVSSEIVNCLNFIRDAYTLLGFSGYTLSLSTRPTEKYIGTLEEWDAAEQSLKDALNSSGIEWNVKEGDGAFYGPKIDVMIKDAIGRSHQTATIQLDFQLPARFKLKYADRSKQTQPVIIHRAVLGSLERMLGILIENYAGKWPFWLSPRQAIVICTRPELKGKAQELFKSLMDRLSTEGMNFYVDMDLTTTETFAKQVRQAKSLSYNYILIVGDRELESGDMFSVTQREENKNIGSMSVSSLVSLFQSLQRDRRATPPRESV